MNLPTEKQVRKVLEAYSKVKKADCFAEDLEAERTRVIKDILGILENEEYTPEVGDLVETCAYIPGILINVSPDDPDDVQVQAFDRLSQYDGKFLGSCHSVRNCGVHPISTLRAMYLNALGDERLKVLWETTDYSDETIRREFENLRKS